jgi:spore coat polysaccharide biosynthesis protein SpsF
MKHPHRLVVATTTEAADDHIVTFCQHERLDYVRGSEHDVLRRYCDAAQHAGADIIVRVTSDCPLLDPALVDRAITEFGEPPGCDYLSNMIAPSWPYGMAVEVFTRGALDEANTEARRPEEREHVTPFIYWRPERYRLRSLTHQPDLSGHRWTVDTPEDFTLVEKILLALYPTRPQFDMNDVLELLARHPDWSSINQHVTQKSLPSLTKED